MPGVGDSNGVPPLAKALALPKALAVGFQSIVNTTIFSLVDYKLFYCSRMTPFL